MRKIFQNRGWNLSRSCDDQAILEPVERNTSTCSKTRVIIVTADNNRNSA